MAWKTRHVCFQTSRSNCIVALVRRPGVVWLVPLAPQYLRSLEEQWKDENLRSFLVGSSLCSSPRWTQLYLMMLVVVECWV